MKDVNGSLALQETVWEELIDGKVTLMSPRPVVNHNLIARNINNIFYNFLRGKSCVPFGDGTDLYLTDGARFVPDGMIVCDRDKIRNDGVHGAPDLVVEVLSPGSEKKDRGRKKDLYEQCGVREYWIVSPGDRSIEQYLLREGRFVLHEVYTEMPDYVLGKLTPEERAEVKTVFRCSLYDDLDIAVADVFSDMI